MKAVAADARQSSRLTINSLFERSVGQFGTALAVKDRRSALSYRELDARVDALASELQRVGVRKGDSALVHAERTVETIAGVLAVLRVGAVLVPVSLDTPPARLAFILRDAGARVALTDERGRQNVQAAGSDFVVVDLGLQIRRSPRREEVDENDLAYAIYTSGTTGEPKGVLIEHGSIARRFFDWDAVFGLLGRSRRCVQLAKPGFDVFIADIVKALCSGGALIVCPDESVLDPRRLHDLLVREAVDYVDTVPAVLLNLVDHLEATGSDLRHIDIINCGADRWTPEEYQRCRRVTRVRRMFNGYGVTECTVESTLFEGDESALARRSTLPIGSALRSDHLLILDEQGREAQTGAIGELCIGGPCVARGYLNRPELDAKAFFLRPDGQGGMRRYYRTGDLARADSEGVFEFLGRRDLQVKLHGQRVELAEIERLLEQEPAVQKAVVCANPGRSALTAFVSLVTGARFDKRDCLQHLAMSLPRYMVPAHIVVLERFPMSQHGKIDRAALAASAPEPLPGERKKRPHDLHLSADVGELVQRLRGRDIDLLSLVSEFVKPGVRHGVLIGGSLADNVATAVSDLDILILLSDASALKQRKREVLGTPVKYLPGVGDSESEVSLFLDGIETDLTFMVNPGIDLDSAVPVVESDAEARANESPYRTRFLSRLSSNWIVHGQDVVERWRQYYRLDNFRIKRILAEFTTATKNLEDLEAGIGLEKGHVGVVGIYVVTATLRALLFYNGYHGCASKWMRVVGRMIDKSDEQTRRAFIAGRQLMFPSLLESGAPEREYYGQVRAFCREVRAILSRDQHLANAIDSIVHDLDITL